jgi:hypothetical protein
MSNLEEELKRLSEWLASQGKLPSLSGHVLAEGARIEEDAEGGFHLVLPREAEYSVSPDRALQSTAVTVSIREFRIAQDRLEVSVECRVPGFSLNMTDVSINFSGPPDIASTTLTRISKDDEET